MTSAPGEQVVDLAVWLAFSARTTTDRILAVVPPISAFVAAGFEHSIANMYFILLAAFIALDREFVATMAPGHPCSPSPGRASFCGICSR